MPLDEKHCPLCGEDNHCNATTEEQTTCWCMTTEFPKGLLASVPIESKGKHCICQKCIDTYKSN